MPEKKKRAVKVVEFTDPSARPKRGKKRARDEAEAKGEGAGQGLKVKDSEKYQVASDFESIWKSVTELGASTFKGRDKKIWEARKLEGLGLRVQHKEKMPRKMWMGVKAKRESRAAREAELAREADLVTGRTAAHAKVKVATKQRFKADPSKSLETGAFKGGVLRVRQPMGSGASASAGKRGTRRGKRR